MSATRSVKYEEGASGLWAMTCAQCPLLPHSEALGVPATKCASGIATNMQGPVMLQSCQHLEPGSFDNTPDNGISIRCKLEPQG